MVAANTFAPIAPQATADLVCQQLEQLIRTGALKPGEKLPAERDLARLLEVSRPTVRQALAQLEMKSLVHTSYGGGSFITNALGAQFVDPLVHLLHNDEAGALQYLEYRYEIEGAAAAFAAERATDSDREILNLVLADMVRIHDLNDGEMEAAADVRLHLAIIEASHNNFFASVSRAMYQLLWRNVRDSWAKICSEESVRLVILDHHRSITNAILRGDPEGSKSAMQKHIAYVMDKLRETSAQNQREAAARARLLAVKREFCPS